MTGRILILHWNELSFPEEITSDDIINAPQWKEYAKSALQAVRQASRVRPDCRISLTKGAFHGQVAGRPFVSWLETWLGKDGLRYIQGRAIQPAALDTEPLHQMNCELSCRGRTGEGITRAHIAEAWTWSLGYEKSGSDGVAIQARKMAIDKVGETDVEVANLAAAEHVTHWVRNLDLYGYVVSHNHVIGKLDRYNIIMYPFDHGYPHVHIHACDDISLNAKFRIDVFESLTDQHPAGLDTMIKQWIDERRELLVRSWQLCQNGGYPLKL